MAVEAVAFLDHGQARRHLSLGILPMLGNGFDKEPHGGGGLDRLPGVVTSVLKFFEVAGTVFEIPNRNLIPDRLARIEEVAISGLKEMNLRHGVADDDRKRGG
jgi:hypothetical protein